MQSLLAKISMAALFAANATATTLPEDEKVDLALDGTHDLLVEMLENIKVNNLLQN